MVLGPETSALDGPLCRAGKNIMRRRKRPPKERQFIHKTLLVGLMRIALQESDKVDAMSDRGVSRGQDLALKAEPQEGRLLGSGPGTDYSGLLGDQRGGKGTRDRGNQNVEGSDQGEIKE